MKIIIDIPDDVRSKIIEIYNSCEELHTRGNLYQAIANGKPYEERPIGKWENITPSNHFTPGGDPVVRCPFCKDRESIHLGGIGGSHWKFCPICGAKMGGNR